MKSIKKENQKCWDRGFCIECAAQGNEKVSEEGERLKSLPEVIPALKKLRGGKGRAGYGGAGKCKVKGAGFVWQKKKADTKVSHVFLNQHSRRKDGRMLKGGGFIKVKQEEKNVRREPSVLDGYLE